MASSSLSSSSSATAFSSQSWSHDVFLSFRGEDTRKNFVDHLYAALIRQGIDTYKDDETLPRGELIGPSLLNAIDESQIAIVIFSKNYANSSWCLDELVHIIKCKDTKGQIVMPVFYDVDPSEVRKQTKMYRESFLKHELENKKKVKSWKKALEDAGNLSGWEPKNISNGHESKVITEIVDEISSRLQLVIASANEELIGIATRVRLLKSELQMGSGGVRMIGIWGVGGGGKTTLASSTYDEICGKFECCCFMANVREKLNKHGLEKLQKKILKKMDGKSNGRGRCLIDKRFRNRKVLIVLDDVDHLDQLKSLVGSPNWFGEGSRIIITTRDEHLLKAHGVVVHDISLLQGDEAIKLFHKHAFRGCLPVKDYEQLSKVVVSYAGGLPLALTVLGSSLCDKNKHQWRSALARLKEIPDTNILEKLRISFDGLTKVQKEMFLDIACFFRWEKKDNAMARLDACGYYPVIGVEELRQKALITISGGEFDMHDLVQEMGHHIVRGEHPRNPEKHSRVWKKEDVLRICAMDANTELDKIEGIKVDDRLWAERPPQIVASMRNLRYIQWKGDPANPLLNNFPPRDLCCLILYRASQEQLWNGYKYLPNLKIMELYNLNNLIMTPSFDGIPYLERFRLYDCPALAEIHSSFGGLVRLVSLRIEYCGGIKKFPSITGLKKLETLSFECSIGLIELSEIQQKMDSLGDDIGHAVWELSNLNHIQQCFFQRDLRRLDLRLCNLGDEEMSSVVWELPNLEELDLSFNEFSQLNFSLMRIPLLKLLKVRNCYGLLKLSNLPSSVSFLDAQECDSLETIGDISNCKWLWRVLLLGAKKVGPLCGYMLVESMLKENAIKDYLISISLPPLQEGIVDRLFMGDKYTIRLPHDWYNDFSGFLIHVVTFELFPKIDIIIKEEVDEVSRFELQQESNEAPEPEYDRAKAYVGYVSFDSLRQTAYLNSVCSVILISLRQSDACLEAFNSIGAALVPKKSKDNLMQTVKVTTDRTEFWDDEVYNRPTFTIEDDSKSSIKILWRPNN